MWRALVGLFAVVLLAQPAHKPVTFAWALDATHVGATWQAEIIWPTNKDHHGQLLECASVTVTATERQCTAFVPFEATTFRLRGMNGSGSVVSSAVTIGVPPPIGTPPGRYTIRVAIPAFVPPPVDPPEPGMAVTIENTNSFEAAADATPDVTLTITSATLLMVGVGYVQGSPVPVSVAWDPPGANQALTRLKRQRESLNTGNAVDIWYLKNPTPGSGKTITADLGAVGNVAVVAYGILGADVSGTTFGDATETGGTADTESGATGTATVTVTTASDALVIDMLTTISLWTVGANQTAIHDSAAVGTAFGSSWQFGSFGGEMSWTKDGGGSAHWAIAAVSINAAPTGPAPSKLLRSNALRPAIFSPGRAR